MPACGRKKFNLEIIKTVFTYDHRIKINNLQNSYNTLSFVIVHFMHSYKNQDKKSVDDVLNLLKLLINYGAEPNNCQTSENTFSLAVNSNNLKIIELIAIETKSVPNNNNISGNMTLTDAVLTNDSNIVKFVCMYPVLADISRTDGNTLSWAILSGNTEIVFEVVRIGAKPSNLNTYPGDRLIDMNSMLVWMNEIIEHFCPLTIDRIFNLIMCSGLKISKKLYNILSSKYKKTCVESKLLICFESMHHLSNLENNQYTTQEIQIFKNELNDTMNQLIHRVDKNIIVSEIEIINLPECLINIIYEYHLQKAMVEEIDWLNDSAN